MTTYPSNRNDNWAATQAAGWRSATPDVPTMAAHFPPTQARSTYAPAYVAAPSPQLAWSAEEPDFSAPQAYSPKPAWFKRPAVLAIAAAALVAAASAGLFGELHSSSNSTQTSMTSHSAPAAAPTPAPAPMPASGSTMPNQQAVSPSTMSRVSHSNSVGHHAMPQMSQDPMASQAPMAPQSQTSDDHDNGSSSDSSQSNHDSSDSSMHRGEKGYHWSDRDHRWVRDDSSDNSDSSRSSSSDHSSDGHSRDSSQNADSK